MQDNDRYQENQNIIQFSERVDSAGESVDKNKKHNCDDIVPLPTELVNYRNKNFYAAGILLVIGVVVALYVKDWKPLMLFILFCAYFVWRGMVVAKDYSSGKIAEVVATCTGIKPSFYKDRITVTFAAEDQDGALSYFKFVIPTRKAEEEFIVGATYVIYFDRVATHTQMGYVQISACVD